MLLTPIELLPRSHKPTASVLWLHGLGADGGDFVPYIQQAQWVERYNARFVFPNAPERAITINGGAIMRAWYDIEAPNFLKQADAQGIQTSHHAIMELLQKEQQSGITNERMILAGFSQGAAMALHVGLRLMQPVAGLIALSGYLPLCELKQEWTECSQQTPIFLAHGNQDTIVPLLWAQQARDQLLQAGYLINWQEYPMGHTVIASELAAIEQFLDKILLGE